MADQELDPERVRLRERAFSRWDNEGGTGDSGRVHPASTEAADIPPLGDAELVQLRIRVIALENVIAVLLADATDQQLDLVREMAAYISPRPGYTQHRLTVHAAARMMSLVKEADHFRGLFGKEASSRGASDRET